MFSTTLSLFGAAILILDIFAIASVLMGSTSAMRKLLWITIILVLPVIGMILYFLIGRSVFDAQV
ncbi:MAG: PLDc N-terminal domain-containing protein [Planctomycetaceae bacterium]